MRDGGVILGINERVRDLRLEVLSDHWYVLRKATFDYRHRDGTWTREVREAYDRGATGWSSSSSTRRPGRCC